MSMKPINHLDHIEDTILTGDFSIIREMFDQDNYISVKVDGCPALVWGTHPKNDKFFVCTKSAFNKKKIKVCYTQTDIDEHFGHQENVHNILTLCLKYLPRTEGVFQGDWIGFGGDTNYKPNVVEYVFPEVVKENIIIAPHTFYTGSGCELYEMQPHPLKGDLISTSRCKFVTFKCEINHNIKPLKINSDGYTFFDKKDLVDVNKNINRLIIEGVTLNEDTLFPILGDVHLCNLYLLIVELKEQLMNSITITEGPQVYIKGLKSHGEGYVMHTKSGVTKLVDRTAFSYMNFTHGAFSGR